ncbi:hypothetical protein MKX01_005558 [Papaver californicum]|nr:hypothetical protein MKX01_005558 [Papaver californicum]
MEAQEQKVMDSNCNIMCMLTDPEGTPVGPSLYLPHNAGPPQLQQLVNKLLNNEDKLPYSFYVSDQELVVQLGAYLEKNKGHTEVVLTVAFSRDGRQLASGSGDTTVRLWDLTTQTPMYTCTGHKNWVLCIAWSPDGKHLVSGSKNGFFSLLLFLNECLTLLLLFQGHKKWITSISWEPVHLSSPCRRFATSSKYGDVRIWDISLRRCVISLNGHTLAVTCVKWGGDGMIYSSSQDCTIKVWETTQGKLIRKLKGHGHWVNSLALSTEYVLRTGAFDHTGKQYSSPEEMKEVALERYNKMRGNAPERLVSGSDDFTMFLWEPAVSKHPKARMTGHQQVWDIQKQKLKQDLPGHEDEVFAVDWSPDGEKVASGGKDRVMKLWM